MLTIIFYIISVVSLGFYFTIAPNDVSFLDLAILLIIGLISIALTVFKKESNIYLRGQYIRHLYLVLLGIVIVHFQLFLDLLLGNIETDELRIWVSTSLIMKEAILSLMGMISFLLGYNILRSKKSDIIFFHRKKYYSTTLLELLSIVTLFSFFITVNPLYLAGFYGQEEMGGAAAYSQILFHVLVFSILIQRIRNITQDEKKDLSFVAYLKGLGTINLLVIVIYLLSVIFSGDRGPIIMFGICIFSGYFIITQKKLTFKTMIILVLLGGSFITLLGKVRNLDKDIDFALRVKESLSESREGEFNSFSKSTQELAKSIKTVGYTLSYIPKEHDFLYGRFQFQQIASSIPFVSYLFPFIFSNKQSRYGDSAKFITWISQGDNATSGEGTSCIADFYCDFGIIGVIIGMLLWGGIVRFCEVEMFFKNVPSLFVHILSTVYLCQGLYIARSTVFFDLKTIIWIFIVLLINKFLFNKIKFL